MPTVPGGRLPAPGSRRRRMTAVPDQSQAPELRDAVARACRILAMEGVADGVLGHVSVRIGDGRKLIRWRGPGELWRYYCAKAARAGLLQPLVKPDGNSSPPRLLPG